MSTSLYELDMDQGADWDATVHWYGGATFRAAIEEIDPGYPTIIRVTGHLLPSASPTPIVISGVQGAEILNSTDSVLELCTYVDEDYFTVPVSTRTCEWVVDSGEITYIQPTDIANFTARCQLRSKWYSGTVIHEFTTENGGITLDANDGSILLSCTAAETAAMDYSRAYGDIELISSLGKVTRVARLIVDFSREMTK